MQKYIKIMIYPKEEHGSQVTHYPKADELIGSGIKKDPRKFYWQVYTEGTVSLQKKILGKVIFQSNWLCENCKAVDLFGGP